VGNSHVEGEYVVMGPVTNTIPREKLLRLAGELLSLAADKFGNHVCNDYDRPSYFSEEEWMRLATEYEQWNSRGQDPVTPPADFVLMAWLSKLIEAGEVATTEELAAGQDPSLWGVFDTWQRRWCPRYGTEEAMGRHAERLNGEHRGTYRYQPLPLPIPTVEQAGGR
jgi:hypothetical protein